MKMRLIVISEVLSQPPFDEGFKKSSLLLAKELNNLCGQFFAIGGKGGENLPFPSLSIALDKVFVNPQLHQALWLHKPDWVLYIPYSSSTLASLMRATMLHLSSPPRTKVALLILQRRHHGPATRALFRKLRAHLFLVLSQKCAAFYRELGAKTVVVPLGVELDRFVPVGTTQKWALRLKYGLPPKDRLLLHVGHLRTSRGIVPLLEVVKRIGWSLLLTVSTSTTKDPHLMDQLQRTRGVKLIDRYVDSIEELYQLADCYLFLATNPTGCIEMPLSVLEAMACNLPVITTPFGGLPDFFQPRDGLFFVESAEEAVKALRSLPNVQVKTREQVLGFSWRNSAERIIKAMAEWEG